ncbi:unnamed protein product [Echinostoma caproni]|uniref:Uncharacterized protein n=1 Tax=Echinostoma caproni TaxID=27848 RepID=A0A3P8HRN5_9TREM|nr:unnamed protein product [Echinostoma caproni]
MVGSAGFLNCATAEHLLNLLHRATDRLFQQAAVDHFSLPEVLAFTRALLLANRETSFTSDNGSIPASINGPVLSVLDPFGINPLLDRLCQLLLDLVRSPHRPLVHLLYIWAAVAPELIKVCHVHGWLIDRTTYAIAQPQVIQRVLDAMHTCILTAITNYPELPLFTTNEAWCKPLENTIKLVAHFVFIPEPEELCDSDVQDRLITCLCALVESGSDYLRSAWKPLFSALRCVRPECVRLPTQSTGQSATDRARLSHQFGLFQRLKHALLRSPRFAHDERSTDECVGDREFKAQFPDIPRGSVELNARRLGTVMEMFEVFLSTVNNEVFCETAIDCLLCLLHILTLFRHSTDRTTIASDEVNSGLVDALPVWSMLDESVSCPADSTNLYPAEFNEILFRTDRNWDDEDTGNVSGLLTADSVPGTTTTTATSVFLTTLTCLIRVIYSLERLWTLPRAPPIRHARYQFHLHCALDLVDSDRKEEMKRQSDTQSNHHPLMTYLDILDQGTGVLFTYCLIVHQLLDTIWTADRVQRGLLLDTVLRLIRCAPLGFPTRPGSSLDHPDCGLAVQLNNYLLLPKARAHTVETWQLFARSVLARANEQFDGTYPNNFGLYERSVRARQGRIQHTCCTGASMYDLAERCRAPSSGSPPTLGPFDPG